MMQILNVSLFVTQRYRKLDYSGFQIDFNNVPGHNVSLFTNLLCIMFYFLIDICYNNETSLCMTDVLNLIRDQFKFNLCRNSSVL